MSVVNCNHMDFEASVQVDRIEDIGRFMANVTVRCKGCKTPFRFLGLKSGMDYQGASVSVGGLEARMGIHPGAAPLPAPPKIRGFDINFKPGEGA